MRGTAPVLGSNDRADPPMLTTLMPASARQRPTPPLAHPRRSQAGHDRGDDQVASTHVIPVLDLGSSPLSGLPIPGRQSSCGSMVQARHFPEGQRTPPEGFDTDVEFR